MPVTLTTTAATDYKPSFAPSVNVGLCVMSNGEDPVQVIDPFGFMTVAGIPTPTDTPRAKAGTANGSMNVGKWVCYAIVYACNRRYPYVEAQAIGGKIYPRGNPGPASAAVQVPSTGSCDVTFQLPENIIRTDITRIWIFRTLDQPSAVKAQQAAAAGDFYYTGRAVMPTANPAGNNYTYTDLDQTPSDDQLEYDNYPAPQFQFCIFCDPYWWGFGNYQAPTNASWDTNGVVTFTDPGYQFNVGRYQQPCYLKSNLDDGDTTNFVRQYYAFPITGSTNTAQLVFDLDGTIPGAGTFQAGDGQLVFAGPSTTLYRSKYRNPMAWGTIDYVGDIRVPSQFYFRVGGGIGTGIAQVPNMPLLVLSTKNPPATYTLDLRTAGTAQFNSSLRCISTLYSTTSHFSQFAAAAPSGGMVLWMYDGDTYTILACDGNSVIPISAPVSQLVRNLTNDKKLQGLVHGLYDSRTQMNCLWLAQAGATDSLDLLLMQHAPTGNWHSQFEGDVLCSTTLQASICGLNLNYVGTDSGIIGSILDSSKTRNWLYETLNLSGTLNVTSQLSNPVPAGASGLIGNWMLVTDGTGGGDQWARIATMAADGITFTVDKVWSPTDGWSEGWIRPPVNGDPYYIGLIEVSLLRYFDFNAFVEDKKLSELWVALENVDLNSPTSIQYFQDRQTDAWVLPTGKINLPLKQVNQTDGTPSQQWMSKAPPSNRIKVFGIRLIDRGYTPLKVYGIAGKVE